MPALTYLETFSAVAGIVDLGLGLAGVIGPDPDAEQRRQLAELNARIEALSAQVDALHDVILEEFRELRALVTETALNEALAEVDIATVRLADYRRLERPDEDDRRVVVAQADDALLYVLRQTGALGGAPDSAVAFAFFGALSYAVAVRLQVAYELEDGAIGKASIRDGLAAAARVFREIPGIVQDSIGQDSQVRIGHRMDRETADGAYYYYYAAASHPLVGSVEIREPEPELLRWFPGLARERSLEIHHDALDRKLPDIVQSRFLDARAVGAIEAEAFEVLGLGGLLPASFALDDLADGVERLGSSGHDALDGTDGNDLLTGLRGRDTLTGGDDADVLRGGSGRDRIDGGAGGDFADGGPGRDSLAGGEGNDVLHGGTGRDLLEGGDGDDRLSGGGGRDRLQGDAGGDTLAGGRGADRLDGGAGDDVLSGGSGRDVFVFAPSGPEGTGSDRILDFDPERDMLRVAAPEGGIAAVIEAEGTRVLHEGGDVLLLGVAVGLDGLALDIV